MSDWNVSKHRRRKSAGYARYHPNIIPALSEERHFFSASAIEVRVTLFQA
jgi:hypothetical protein